MRREEDKGWSSTLYCVTSTHIYIYSIKPLLVGFIDLPLTTLNLANILQRDQFKSQLSASFKLGLLEPGAVQTISNFQE
jgi:hypothetical protein